MECTRRGFLGAAAAFAGAGRLLGDEAVEVRGHEPWEREDGSASDAVMVRRLHVDLAGRLPLTSEAQGYVYACAPERKAELVDALLASPSYADYWSMKFCDILRVKSEFPINLWPNAVYVYHRRIREFVRTDEPWDRFARALLTATGSDFRNAEANFFRATARRTPEGLAEAALVTFLGGTWEETSEAERKELAYYFENVHVKSTREWKEEVLVVDGEDRRGEFAARLTGEWRERFARAFVARIDRWMLGRTEADPEHVRIFIENGWRLKPLLRAIALSEEYGRGSVTGGFMCRRLDAEVLDDAICDITGATRDYQSIAPEPFTFLPPDRKSVLIEDGSITSAFLLLFGRPARDTGRLDERHNEVTAKQRLYLFNSGKLFQRLSRLTDSKEFRRLRPREMFANLYWRFLSRAPTEAENAMLLARFNAAPKGRARWMFPKDVAWALLNSKEFLYQH